MKVSLGSGPHLAIGLMSGTSHDGVSAALVRIDERSNPAAGSDNRNNQQPVTHLNQAEFSLFCAVQPMKRYPTPTTVSMQSPQTPSFWRSRRI